MARNPVTSIYVDQGDEPKVDVLGPYVYVEVDGHPGHPLLQFRSVNEAERWLDEASLQVALHKIRLRETAASDDDYDAACEAVSGR